MPVAPTTKMTDLAREDGMAAIARVRGSMERRAWRGGEVMLGIAESSPLALHLGVECQVFSRSIVAVIVEKLCDSTPELLMTCARCI